jgi:glycosyltransferase involved in cell wall biosynthesis
MDAEVRNALNIPDYHHLRVTHITADHSEVSGGVARVVDQLTRHTSRSISETEIICISPNPMPPADGVSLNVYSPENGVISWGRSKRLLEHLRSIAKDRDNRIFHIHGVWLAPQYYASKIANANSIPTIITCHAMLLPWFWNGQGTLKWLKKYIYWKILAERAFSNSTVIHAITDAEGRHLKKLFPDNRVIVIPNAVDLVLIDEQREEINAALEPIILFLGRIHPQKGIDLLISAFSKADLGAKWKLIIAGPPEDEVYYNTIAKIVEQEGLTSRVEFIGPTFGREKFSLISRAWIVVVPSRVEVIGMVNLESAACYTPTITTYETGLTDWSDGGGILVNTDVEMLSSALIEACNWSYDERLDRGRCIRSLIENKYSWDAVLGNWLDLYASL